MLAFQVTLWYLYMYQADFCAFHKFFPLYNFVGNLEQSAIHGPALLKKLGLWDEYGARQWSLASIMKTPIGNSGHSRDIAMLKNPKFKYPKVNSMKKLSRCMCY